VPSGGRLVDVPHVQEEPVGILHRAQDVEAQVAVLPDRRLVVRPGRVQERLDLVGLDVDVDEGDEHQASRA
jgi:hypothetical protein